MTTLVGIAGGGSTRKTVTRASAQASTSHSILDLEVLRVVHVGAGKPKRRIRELIDEQTWISRTPQVRPPASAAAGRVVRRYIAGEPFNIEYGEGDVIISHREWSLMGTGESELAAEADLRLEARNLYEVMESLPVDSLSFAALRMRDFLLRIV